jgi:hypothetical protein
LSFGESVFSHCFIFFFALLPSLPLWDSLLCFLFLFAAAFFFSASYFAQKASPIGRKADKKRQQRKEIGNSNKTTRKGGEKREEKR